MTSHDTPTADTPARDRQARALLRRLPRYQQIAEELREQITDGTLLPGAVIPSETELGALYGVSRITVRHAIAALRTAGLVVTEHGRASRVRDPRPVLAFTPTITRDGDGTWHTWDQDPEWSDAEAPLRYRTTAPHHAPALGTAPGETVLIHERTLTHTPTGTRILWTLTVPLATVQTHDLNGTDALTDTPTLLQALHHATGTPPTWTDTLTARMPTPDQTTTLHLTEGTPLLAHTRTLHTPTGPAALETTHLPSPTHYQPPPPRP
jgi:GntR family transcriptional regulator